MEKNIELTNGNWLLVKGSPTIVPSLLQIAARLAETGPVRIIDGGFRYNPFLVNYLVYERSEVLERIQVKHAESSHEILAFLEDMPVNAEPFIVLDLLNLFFDPFVHIGERRRMLKLCLNHLNRLAKGSGGVVSIHPPHIPSQTECDFMEMVSEAAQDTFHVEMSAPGSMQVGYR